MRLKKTYLVGIEELQHLLAELPSVGAYLDYAKQQRIHPDPTAQMLHRLNHLKNNAISITVLKELCKYKMSSTILL